MTPDQAAQIKAQMDLSESSRRRQLVRQAMESGEEPFSREWIKGRLHVLVIVAWVFGGPFAAGFTGTEIGTGYLAWALIMVLAFIYWAKRQVHRRIDAIAKLLELEKLN